MCGKKFLCQWLWHSLAKLCTKNYENPSIFVKVTAKKSVAPFFLDTVYMFGMTLTRPSLAIQLTSIAWTSSHICSGKRRTLRATIVTTFSHMIRAFQFLSNVTRFLHCFFLEITTNSNFQLSQGSAATHWRYALKYHTNMVFVGNLVLFPAVKEFLKIR